MSFNQPFDGDLERGDAVSAHFSDHPEFDSLSQLIDNSLYNINNTYLSSIRNLIQQYELTLQHADAEHQLKAAKISQKISDLSTKCTQGFKKINEATKELNGYLRRCEQNHEDEDTIKYLMQKESISVNIIQNSLTRFRKLQAKYDALQKKYVGDITNNPAHETGSESQAGGQSQHSIQIQYEPINAEELEQQTLLIEEREREIQQISQDTQEINEIFLNLQDIILEQQFQIDNIEDNILSYQTDVQGASRELRKAERYQKRAGGRMICCLMILIGVFGSIIFIGLIF